MLSLVLNTVDPGLKIAGVTDLRKRKRVEGEGKAQERERSLLLFGPLVEPFRNERQRDDRGFRSDDTEAFPPGYF